MGIMKMMMRKMNQFMKFLSQILLYINNILKIIKIQKIIIFQPKKQWKYGKEILRVISLLKK